MTPTTKTTTNQIDWSEFPFQPQQLVAYLTTLYGNGITILGVRKLKEESSEQLKEFGYGNPLLIEFQCEQDGVDWASEQTIIRVVFHTMAPERFGHERRADRAYNLLLEYDTFDKLPHHAPSADVGALTKAGDFISLGEAGEFFHLSKFVPGTLYADDLPEILARNTLLPQDTARVDILADYLAEIHAQKHSEPTTTEQLYRRTWRDLVGHGEGIMGMMDTYPVDFAVAPRERLRAIEHACIDWRWRCHAQSDRLSQIHGDFHPWNVLFQAGNDFALLDRSRGEWGEPADDVSAMTINYLLFSLRQQGALAGPFGELFARFWERYLTKSKDEKILDVVPPFFAWRALVVAHPVWYPSLDTAVRAALFHFVENVLAVERFDPTQVNRYLVAGRA